MMMTYLDGGEISVEMIKKAIRKGTLEVKFFPVLCGTALGNKGIKLLLDAVIDYFFFSFLAPYLLRPCFLSLTPAVSKVPRTI